MQRLQVKIFIMKWMLLLHSKKVLGAWTHILNLLDFSRGSSESGGSRDVSVIRQRGTIEIVHV